MNTQLSAAIGYNTNNMIFSEPIVSTISSGAVPVSYRRIMISTRNPDGTVGDLIIPVKGFSYGVSENTDFNTGKPNGYVFPICLQTRGGATDDEKAWINSFNNIVDRCKKHLVENRKEIQNYDLEERDLKKLNPIYYKRVNGELDPTSTPTFYVKLITSKDKKTGETNIKSKFYDEADNELDPLNIIGKYCNANAALKVESLFVGNKISLQVKLYEAEITLIQSGMKRLLSSTTEAPKRIIHKTVTPVKEKTDSEVVNDEDVGSINGEEDVEEVEEKPKTTKVVKKVVRKVKKST